MSIIKDRYASAVRSSNLKSVPKTVFSDADVLSAYAIADRRLSNGEDHYSKHPLAVPLERLFTGDSTAATEIVRILADIIRGKSIAMRLDLTRTQRIDMARAVLGWFRHPACPKCGGHGFKIIPGTTTVGGQRCQPCDATGKVPLERLFRVEQRELVRWLVSKMELEAGLAAPVAMKALAPLLNLD